MNPIRQSIEKQKSERLSALRQNAEACQGRLRELGAVEALESFKELLLELVGEGALMTDPEVGEFQEIPDDESEKESSAQAVLRLFFHPFENLRIEVGSGPIRKTGDHSYTYPVAKRDWIDLTRLVDAYRELVVIVYAERDISDTSGEIKSGLTIRMNGVTHLAIEKTFILSMLPVSGGDDLIRLLGEVWEFGVTKYSAQVKDVDANMSFGESLRWRIVESGGYRWRPKRGIAIVSG